MSARNILHLIQSVGRVPSPVFYFSKILQKEFNKLKQNNVRLHQIWQIIESRNCKIIHIMKQNPFLSKPVIKTYHHFSFAYVGVSICDQMNFAINDFDSA